MQRVKFYNLFYFDAWAGLLLITSGVGSPPMNIFSTCQSVRRPVRDLPSLWPVCHLNLWHILNHPCGWQGVTPVGLLEINNYLTFVPYITLTK